MTTIAVVGSMNIDFVIEVGHFPRPGETVTGRSLRLYPGGKGANQAYAAARVASGGNPAVRVAMVGQVGGDAHADRLVDSLRAAGVDVSNVSRDSDHPTGTALIAIDDGGQNQIVVVAGANDTLSPARLERCESTLATARILLVQMEVPVETVARAAAVTRAGGGVVVLDPAPAGPLPDALWANVDFLTPNESELCTLLGRPSTGGLSRTEAAAGAQTLRTRGVRNVIVKMGGTGALLVTASGEHFIPAFPVTAVDTTAAGDAFNGGFAVALAEGQPPAQAARFAAAVAACSVTRAGAQPSMPTRSEVASLLGA